MGKVIKGIILVILFVLSIMFGYLYAVSNNWGTSVEAAEDDRMLVVSRIYSGEYYRIYVDKVTRVMYLRDKTANDGVFTLMVDQDGKPLLWDGQ